MIERIKNVLQDLAQQINSSSHQSDPVFWKEKAKALYEVLSVYVFLYQQQDAKSDWEAHENQLKAAVSKLENVSFSTQKPLEKREEETLNVPPLMDTINDILTEMPDQALPEELFQEVSPAPSFEKKETAEEQKQETLTENKKNLNDRFSKGLKIDLNDRIAFISHLFNNQSADYHRVIKQLFTFSNWEEAKDFIDNMVKPDYNNWKGKEDFEARFMRVLELHFDLPAENL